MDLIALIPPVVLFLLFLMEHKRARSAERRLKVYKKIAKDWEELAEKWQHTNQQWQALYTDLKKSINR